MKIRLYTLPNMITLLNLLSGCVAIVYMLIHKNLELGFALVCLAAVFDFCDGLVARATGSYSATGKELDSLADVISFGVAPSAALFTLALQSGVAENYALGMFVVAGFSALRLAKFNVDESQKDTFVGLPTPAMAIFVLSGAYVISQHNIILPAYVLYVVAALCCFLMVCDVEMFALKFSKYSFKGNELRYSFVILSALAVVLFGVAALPFIIAGYVLVSSLVWVMKKR
ncbi:MAG: CDP-diacylglycerol--serine O-phosphatidyltransferase [Rikenellaceae bacterium]